MASLEPNVVTVGAEPRSRATWLLLLFVTAAFFIIEHDLSSPKMFQQMMTAESLDEFDQISSMFTPQAWRQIGGLSLGLFGVAAFLTRRRGDGQTLDMLGTLIFFFAGWCSLSLLWSDVADQSLRRLVLLFMLGVGAAGLANTLAPRNLLLLAVLAPLIYLVLGVGAEIAAGTFQPLQSAYRFSGTMHPNRGAINFAVFFLAAWALWKEKRRRVFLLMAFVAFVFLFLTKSRTAMASVIAVAVLQYALSRGHSARLAMVSSVVAFVSLLVLVGPFLFSSVPEGATFRRGGERESFGTLTGRTKLWGQLSGFYEERPVLGYGYGAFWSEDRSHDVMEEQGWPISHAHNAYLDTLLESGPVGLLVYALILILGMVRAVAYYRRSGDVAYWFFASVLSFCLLDGFLESVPIHRGMLTFFALVILAYLAFHKAPQPLATAEAAA